jgi:hypothetical protein
VYVYIFFDEVKKFIIGSGESIPKCEEKRLVFYEIFDSLNEANERMKTILSWPERKIQFLINLVNPSWVDWKKELLNSSEFSGCAENF